MPLLLRHIFNSLQFSAIQKFNFFFKTFIFFKYIFISYYNKLLFNNDLKNIKDIRFMTNFKIKRKIYVFFNIKDF